MNLLRAVGISSALFVVSLVINAIAGRAIGVNLSVALPDDLPWKMWLVGAVSAPVLATIGAVWYFADGSLLRTAATGAILGAVMVVTGIALDCLFILPLKSGPAIMGRYFRTWQYWLTLGLLAATSTLAGAWPLGG
jgi:hypothetical protein